jgi:kynurenine formamidase
LSGGTPRAGAQPLSLARTLRFGADVPRWFGAAAPSAIPLVAGSFTGDVRRGGSCNCVVTTFAAHCHGTHTECVAHLTLEPLDVCDVAPLGTVPAVLLSVAPRADALGGEDSDPPPRPGDRLVTRDALERAWASIDRRAAPRAAILRTGAAAPSGAPAYLSRQAAELLVERGIEHVVVELPSIDREDDGGRLCAHRIFFGLPPGGVRLADAARAHCTVTELASVPEVAADGSFLLQLALPAIAGDAVPSRPLLWPATPDGAPP